MKNFVFALLALLPTALFAADQTYSPAGGILYITAASPTSSALGKQVDFSGNIVTVSNPTDSVGIVTDIQGSAYLISSPLWLTGNCYVAFSGTSSNFPAGAWLVLDSSGNHILETSPGEEVRVARVADHQSNSNFVTALGLSNMVAAVPVHPQRGPLAASYMMNRANQTGTAPKSSVGLGSVDNTSDASKPVSAATQTALDAKLAFPSLPTSQSFTLGTAFQPNTTRPFQLTVNGSLTGIVALNETLTFSFCATQNGTYTDLKVLQFSITLALLTDRGTFTTPLLPATTWVKITRSGSALTATAARTDF